MYYTEEKKTTPLMVLVRIAIVLAGILIGFLISRIFVTPYEVANNSMVPSLTKGQRILIMKHVTPEFGDIILIDSPVTSDYVLLRRVIGSSGDTIEIKNKVFYRNGNKMKFTWKYTVKDARNFPMTFSFRDNMPIKKLKRNEYFVINDNLDNGYDSRTFGVIPSDSVVGSLLYAF